MTRKTTAPQADETEQQAAQQDAPTYVVQWDLKLNGKRLQAGDEITLTDDELASLGGSAVVQLKG